MFAFTVLPFFILSIYCNKKRFTILFLIALLLSTSSSAIIGIFIYLILEIFIGYNRFKKLLISTLLFCIFLYVSYDFMLALYQSIIDKISLASLSGIDRYFILKLILIYGLTLLFCKNYLVMALDIFDLLMAFLHY